MNIVIVDDHPLFRQALIQAVQSHLPDAEIVETASVAELYDFLEQNEQPDLLLLDLHLPESSGFSALVHIRAQYPALAVIVVSAHQENNIIYRAMAHGAMGYIPKSAPSGHIGEAINAVLEGDMWLPPQYRDYVPPVAMTMQATQEVDLSQRMQSLTPQQFRVLMMLAEGLLNKQIAFELGVSEATIKAHATAIFRKLGVHNRTQAVLAISALHIDNANKPLS